MLIDLNIKLDMMNIRNSSIGWFAANVVSSALNFVAVIFFSRVLGASTLGVYFLFFSLVQVLNFLSNGGLSSATIKRISEGGEVGPLLGASILMRLVLFFIVTIFIIIAREPLGDYLQADLVFPLIFVIFLLQFSDLIRELLQGIHRVGMSALVDLIQQVGKVITQVTLVGFGLVGLIIGLISGILTSIGCGLLLTRPKLSMPKKDDVLSLFRFSRFAYGNSLGGLIFDWVGILAVGFFFGSTEAGVFAVCWSFSVFALLLSQALSNTIYPSVSRLSIHGDNTNIQHILENALAYTPLLTLPALFGSFAIGGIFLSLVYGPEFSSAGLVLTLLIATRMVQSFQMVITRTLEGLDHPDIVFTNTMLTILVNVSTLIIFVPLFGGMGAAFSALLTISASLLFNSIRLRQIVTIRFNSLLVWEIGASFLMYIFVMVILYFISLDTPIKLVGVVIFGIFIYIGVLFTNKDLRDALKGTVGKRL